MSVTALKATHTETTHVTETPAAVRTQETRRVKEASHVETKAVEPVRPPAATSSSGVQGALVSLKKGG